MKCSELLGPRYDEQVATGVRVFFVLRGEETCVQEAPNGRTGPREPNATKRRNDYFIYRIVSSAIVMICKLNMHATHDED